ncbi:hypothetical protein W02_07190 [Nitrospira sp. KM1]|nr:hypothetical protein W02_07190 [Nitrospira sp. KM1]
MTVKTFSTAAGGFAESTNLNVGENAPVCVGVPLITPEEFNASPGGSPGELAPSLQV